jgi:hypothetical protein
MDSIEWHGLYSESWGSDLVPEAYAHPAKYSRGLIKQIYAYMLEQGMIAPGDTIGDPFGGQAGGALDAMLNGLHWRGVELEPRFVDLGNQNIELWNGRYAPHFARWGTAVLMQGDSRQFAEIVGGRAGVVISPPFSPPGNNPTGGSQFVRKDYHKSKWGIKPETDYGGSPGQVGAMPMKDADLDAAISSPPYSDTIERGDGPGARWDAEGHPGNPDKVSSDASYGDTPGNTGNTTGATFWQASKTIVEQVHLALKPGGYVAWVTGDFVRKGQRVEFGKQWLALCEACGFEAIAWAIAWKTEHHGTQRGIFEDVEKRTDRVSFFRRLANEKNPEAAILNEDVIFMRKR